MKKYIYFAICTFGLAIVFLAIGAGFHGWRLDTANQEHFKIGVTIGIVMMSLAICSMIAGGVLIALYLLGKKRLDSDDLLL